MLSLLVIGHQKKEKQERWLLSVNCGSLLYDRGLLWVQTFLLFSFFCVYQRTLELFRARAAFFFFCASIPFLLFLLVLWPCDSQMLCSKHKARWLSFLPRENSCGLWFYCRWAPLESFLFIYYSCLLSKIECSPSNLVMYKCFAFNFVEKMWSCLTFLREKRAFEGKPWGVKQSHLAEWSYWIINTPTKIRKV